MAESKIGKMYVSFVPFINKKNHSLEYKSRPILIIAEPIGLDTEYTVLPVSTVSNRAFYNPSYDVYLEKSKLLKLTISSNCYIRTHKLTPIYRSNIDFDKFIGDLKNDYSEIYSEILGKLEKFTSTVIVGAK